MGINKKLFQKVHPYLRDYGCAETDLIHHFLTTRTFSTRQKQAIGLISAIITEHGKQNVLAQVAELARVELGIRKLQQRQRDHVVHAFLSFLLGIYINEHFSTPKHPHVQAFHWKLAGLLHDIGYPPQIAQTMLDDYSGKIKASRRTPILPSELPHFKVVPRNLDRLPSGRNSLDLIQTKLDGWQLRIDVRGEYERMSGDGWFSHGIVSAMSVMYVIDSLYEEHNPGHEARGPNMPRLNWDRTTFEVDVVAACSAIFVHDLPEPCFTHFPINRDHAPLAFLLRLSDCLQDWNRPSQEEPDGAGSSQFDITVSDNHLLFSVADEKRRNKINAEIQSTLVAPDVEVLSPEAFKSRLP